MRRRWLPRRSVRLRLTLLYSSVFLVAGAALLGITYLVVAQQTGQKTVAFRVAGTAGPAPAVTVQQFETGGVQGPTLAGDTKVPPAGQVQRAVSDERTRQLDTLLTWSGITLGIMAVLSIGLGWLLAGRVLRPLRTMTMRTRRISEHNLHERLALDGPGDELKELGDTIDGLLGRLHGAFDAQRRFVANASHELRTPLTLERAMIEVALADPDATVEDLRSVCERVLVAGEQQERLIESLLTLARSQRGLDSRRAFALDDVVRSVLDRVETAAGDEDPGIAAALDPAATLGDPRLVERLVANLIDNAVRHNVPGGWVHVSTKARGAAATLHVANSGPVVAPDEVDRLLEPFRRAAPERAAQADGLGLGLSIAAAVVTAHGASMRLRARVEGGLDVEVSFPASSGEALAPRRGASAGRDAGEGVPRPARASC